MWRPYRRERLEYEDNGYDLVKLRGGAAAGYARLTVAAAAAAEAMDAESELGAQRPLESSIGAGEDIIATRAMAMPVYHHTSIEWTLRLANEVC